MVEHHLRGLLDPPHPSVLILPCAHKYGCTQKLGEGIFFCLFLCQCGLSLHLSRDTRPQHSSYEIDPDLVSLGGMDSWSSDHFSELSGRWNENLRLALISEMVDQAQVSSFFFDFNWGFLTLCFSLGRVKQQREQEGMRFLSVLFLLMIHQLTFFLTLSLAAGYSRSPIVSPSNFLGISNKNVDFVYGKDVLLFHLGVFIRVPSLC